MTVVLIGGLVWVGTAPRGGVAPPTAEELEAYAYLHVERRLAQRAQHADAAPVGAVCGEAAGEADCPKDGEADAALATGERWALYEPSATAPLAVSIGSWREDYPRGDEVSIPVTLINDTGSEEMVDLRLLAVLEDGTTAESSRLRREQVPASGRLTLALPIRIPNSGPYVLVAESRPRNAVHPTTWSRRKIGFAGPGAAIPDPPFRMSCCGTGG